MIICIIETGARDEPANAIIDDWAGRERQIPPTD